jgi:CRISPR-associated endoribonuclease Cas2 subtype I-E
MLVLVLECAPPKVYGFCSSWALQVATGVYVANLPTKTREEIWEQVVQWSNAETRAVMLWSSSANEQGLEYRMIGEPRRRVSEREGLFISTWIPREPNGSNIPEQSP